MEMHHISKNWERVFDFQYKVVTGQSAPLIPKILIMSQQTPAGSMYVGGWIGPCKRNGGQQGITHSPSTRDKSICEYTECSTVGGKFCEFPFRYKGRLYDTCISVDEKGSESGDAWCSTSVDLITRDHIPGEVNNNTQLA